MEPVSTTAIYSLLTYFIAYYVGGDLYNYYKTREDFQQVKRQLNDINNKLDNLNNKMNNKLP